MPVVWARPSRSIPKHRRSSCPLILRDLCSGGMDPRYILYPQLLDILARQEPIPSQDRIFVSQVSEPLDEVNERFPFSSSFQLSQLTSLSWQ